MEVKHYDGWKHLSLRSELPRISLNCQVSMWLKTTRDTIAASYRKPFKEETTMSGGNIMYLCEGAGTGSG